jgi:hypothetical protein
MINRRIVLSCVLGASTLFTGAGCGTDRAPGTIEVRAYGEAFIEDHIPADEFSDGWSVKFDRFLVSVSEVGVAAGHAGTPVVASTSIQVFNLAQPTAGEGLLVATGTAPGGRYDHVRYTIEPAAAGAVATAGVPAGALDAMIAAGESIRVEGTAEKPGSATITFAWGFTSTVSHACHTPVTVDGATATTEITIHGDHLFYDDLVSATPMVAFELIATSDGDGDGTVTQAELAARDISTQARYQVGNTGIGDLWRFIAYQATTVGHIDGESHCDTMVE